ncbi:MAG: GNAT family N-acetyltransferase [Patescibacteria group bacterium]
MEFRKTKQEGCYGVRISAEENGKTAGWAFLIIIANDRHIEPYGLMENVYIEEEYRGGGIGTKLVELVIEEAKIRGCYKLLATCRHSKPQVHSMYEKHGFRNHGLEFRMDLTETKVLTKD